MASDGAWSHRTHTTGRLLPTARLKPADFAPFGEVIQNPATHGNEPKLEFTSANQGSATKWLDVTQMYDFYEFSGSKETARVVMNLFVCQPRELKQVQGRSVFPVTILERHPFTAQTFIPLGLSAADKNVRYLVIVAPTLPVQTERETSDLQPSHPTPSAEPKQRLKENPVNVTPNPLTDDYEFTTRPSSTGNPSGPERKGTGLPDLNNIRAFIANGDQAVTYGAGTWHAPMVVLGEKAVDFVVVQYSNGVAAEDCQEFEIQPNNEADGLAVDVSDSAMMKGKL